MQFFLHGGRFGLQAGGFFFEVGDETFVLFGFVAFALTHQRADLFGGFVLGRQRGVQFGLDGLAAVIQREDLFDDGCRVDPFLGQLADGGLAVVTDLLDCKHGYFVIFEFRLQPTKIQNNS